MAVPASTLHRGWRRWAFWLVVVGTNSIAAYMIAHLFDSFLFAMFTTHLGPGFFAILGEAFRPLPHGAAVLLSYWLILFWMHRKKVYIKI